MEDARTQLSLPENKYIIGYCGSLKTMGEDKGVADILRSLSFLSFDVLCVIVGGSTDDISYYKNMAEELEVKDKVLFVGFVSQSRLAMYQKSFDTLLMPFPNTPHYAHVMSPVKMFEYMASKKPIIASDLPTIREVLNDTNCLFCLPGDSKDLATKIQHLIDTPTLSSVLGEKAYCDVQVYSSSSRAVRIISHIFDS